MCGRAVTHRQRNKTAYYPSIHPICCGEMSNSINTWGCRFMSPSDDVGPSCRAVELFLNQHPCTLKQVLQNHLICFGKVKQPGSAHCACQWWHKRSELSSLPVRSKHYLSWEQLTVKVALLCDDPRAKASVLDLHSLLGMLWIWAPWMAESWRGCIRPTLTVSAVSWVGR